MRHVEKDRESDASRRWYERHTISRGKECASTRMMKRVVGVYRSNLGMDGDKRRGEACVCARHTWLERHIDRCVP